MTVRTLIFCEYCTRSEDAEGSKQRGWGQVSVLDKGVRDACPTCLAGMEGWKNGHGYPGRGGTVGLARRVMESH
jgi:hypothetical protein